jgi:hypothetical protein
MYSVFIVSLICSQTMPAMAVILDKQGIYDFFSINIESRISKIHLDPIHSLIQSSLYIE